MTTSSAPSAPPPKIEIDDAQPSRLRLSGRWTLEFATQIGDRLCELPRSATVVDATGVERLDSMGVLQLIRFARRNGLDFDGFVFREDHRALVAAIEDVPDDRPKRRREFGFNAALARLGVAVTHDWKEFLALIAFFGETLVKLLRMVKEPGRFRPIA
ncbi:MAG TPA: STAS domain-containing protein, partial [Lysobacter sp.]